MVNEFDDVIDAETEHGGFVKGVAGQVVHVLPELVVDEDSRG